MFARFYKTETVICLNDAKKNVQRSWKVFIESCHFYEFRVKKETMHVVANGWRFLRQLFKVD